MIQYFILILTAWILSYMIIFDDIESYIKDYIEEDDSKIVVRVALFTVSPLLLHFTWRESYEKSI